ncbi:MAG: hypothetical protein AB199_01465 [Parcubacteria bacterium C7867-004]|nr:MAG: hypothetical protein AB199_01465 [Parcubacteria bacterium C7867-004]
MKFNIWIQLLKIYNQFSYSFSAIVGNIKFKLGIAYWMVSLNT